MTNRRYELRLPALEIHQGPGKILYSFAIDGKLLPLNRPWVVGGDPD